MLALVEMSLATPVSPDPAKAPLMAGFHAVKFKGIEETVKLNKGKVVVVSFWANWCVPCRMTFPQLVDLNHRYADKGLAVVAVNIDDPQDKQARQQVLQFLKDRKATFINLALADGEKPEDWLESLKIDAVPHVFVYDKEGKLNERFLGGDKLKDVEELAIELLKKK
jgi:thiol-disulfide isomerase/thioredoxin